MTTTGAARRWGPYLDEAMRNRGAAAALGLVPSSELVPAAGPIASVGPGRIVMALDTDGGGSLLHATCPAMSPMPRPTGAGRARREALPDVDRMTYGPDT
jgi:hypothetical protein